MKMQNEDLHSRHEVEQALKALFDAKNELAHEWLLDKIRRRRETISQLQKEIIQNEDMRTKILERGADAMDLLEKVGLKINPNTLEVEGGELHPIYGDLCGQKLTSQVACGGDSEEDRNN